MLATLVAAALTVIGFIIGQVSEGAYKWDEDLGSTLEYSSGFLTGSYSLNIKQNHFFYFSPTLHIMGEFQNAKLYHTLKYLSMQI